MTREERIVLLNGFRADPEDEYAKIIEKAIQEIIDDYRELIEIEKNHQKENGKLRLMIDMMADNMTTPIGGKDWVVKYYEEKVKKILGK